MSRNTRKRRESIQLTNFISKIEDCSHYMAAQDNSQTSSPYERCEDGTLSTYKSHSVLTFATCPLNTAPTKRIKLNDSLSYCMIPAKSSNHHYLFPQNPSSSTLLSSGRNQRATSSYFVSTSSSSEIARESQRSSFNDYESYLHSFPDYRLGRNCSYKYIRNDVQLTHSANTQLRNNSNSNSPHQLAPILDYQNLVHLFTNQHFSVQVEDCAVIQERCMNFIRHYSLSNSSSSLEYNTQQSLLQQNLLPLTTTTYSMQIESLEKKNSTNSRQNSQQAHLNLSNSSQSANKQVYKHGQGAKGRELSSSFAESEKRNQISQRYELLLKNIQYGFIKEITGITKIEFSQRTISKVISKFILFLKGDYRSLKYFDLDHKFEKETAGQGKGKAAGFSKNRNCDELGGALSGKSNLEIASTFDLFKLLEEQDHKEFGQPSPSNKGKQTVLKEKNRQNSITAASSQGFGGDLSEFSDKNAIAFNQRSDLSLQHNHGFLNVKEEALNESTLEEKAITYNSVEKGREDNQANRTISQSPSVKKERMKIESPCQKQGDISFCGEGDQSTNVMSNKSQIKQKQTLFNLSKYLMHLILEFLSEDHLGGLDIIPGFLPLVQNVIQKIKKKGQRTEHSQTYYYNHSHYNCLFLLLNTNSIDQIQKQDELLQLHQFVFEVPDFLQPYNITQINIIKSIIARLIIKQFKILRQIINTQIAADPHQYSNYKNYMITKLQYFERVFQGIQNLKKGSFLVRF